MVTSRLANYKIGIIFVIAAVFWTLLSALQTIWYFEQSSFTDTTYNVPIVLGYLAIWLAGVAGLELGRKWLTDYLFARKKTEQAIADFSNQLAVLHELANELSLAPTSDELCRQAVELGKAKLGFSRLSIWLIKSNLAGADAVSLRGSFGTSVTGEIVDERAIVVPVKGRFAENLAERRHYFYVCNDDLYDGDGNIIGKGAHVRAFLWDGSRVIGAINADDLLNPGSLTEQQAKILALYAVTIGHLCSRKRAEEATADFNHKLTLLHEVTNVLSHAESFDELCKAAVELGRSKLGFPRLGIWFLKDTKAQPTPESVLQGSFGTTITGETRDEHHLTSLLGNDLAGRFFHKTEYFYRVGPIQDERNVVLGEGVSAVALLWDGTTAIGVIGADDLCSPGCLTENMAKILALYAVSIGHLCSRKRVEEAAREFSDQLTVLHEVTNELSRAQTFDDLCRQAVELGRSRLGFPRLGIWFLNDPEKEVLAVTTMHGSFGTSTTGETTDERQVVSPVGKDFKEDILTQRRFRYEQNVWLHGEKGRVAIGTRAGALLWDGSAAIGAIAADDLLNPGSLTENKAKILALYAVTIGHLCSRKRAEEAAQRFSERLTVLHEVANELSHAETFDELCRQAVELGRNRLGYPRLGMWFFDQPQLKPTPECAMHGSFGTSPTGDTVDERNVRNFFGPTFNEVVVQKKECLYMQTSPIYNLNKEVIGHAARAGAMLSDGTMAIGVIGADDLHHPGSLTLEQAKLLALYAVTIGHLCSRKRAEEAALRFNEQLTVLHEITNELSRARTFDDLCREAVELGRERLGFSRLGIWFVAPNQPDDGSSSVMVGSFGTSTTGETIDERSIVAKQDIIFENLIKDGKRLYYVKQDMLLDGYHSQVGAGAHAMASLWDGAVIVGSISADDLLAPGSLTKDKAELLVLYASNIGHLCSRKRAEEALRASEEQYRTLFNHSGDAIILHDLNGQIIDTNDETCRQLGYTIDEIRSLAITDIDTSQFAAMVPERMQRLVEDRHLIFETVHRRKDGTTLPIEVNARLINYYGRRLILSTSRDLTRRKQAEKALRDSELALKQSQQMAMVGHYDFDVQSGTWTSSDMLDKIFGISHDVKHDRALWVNTIVHPLDQEVLNKYLTEHVLTQKNPFDKEYRIIRQTDQAERWVHVIGKLSFDADGKPVKMFGTIQDITERKQIEADRLKLEEQLRQVQKMEAVGQLAGGIAHDFNNLLQVIMGHLELVQQNMEKDSRNQRGLGVVYQAAARAAELTRQLLAFSRRQVIQPINLDLNELIRGVLKMIRRVISEDIELCFISGDRLGTVHADPGQLEQVMMNLCVNARDAMTAGGTLTIETENVTITNDYCRSHSWAVAGRYVLLSVTDTGHGMDEETQSQIFEPFFTTKPIGQGTGLGLATVYGILQQHNAQINVYSEPGRGTTFKVYFPIVERSADTVGPKIEANTSGGTETILVAEDEPMVRELVTDLLTDVGYTILTACDGEEAIRVFDENAEVIDLALLDIVMPKLGGRDVMERIQTRSPGTKFLFSSGYTENAIHTNFVLKEGMYLITKPYRREDLLRAVRQAIDTQ